MDDKTSPIAKSESSSSKDQATKVWHQHSHSMDKSTTKKSNMSNDGSKKPWSKRTQHSLIDPNRARRILAKRKFFERLRERKRNRYFYNLSKEVQALQAKAKSICAQTSMYKRDALRMAAENNALKLTLQTIMENVQRKKAIIDALKEELRHLKAEVMLQEEILSGRVQQDYDNNQATHIVLALPQLQQEDGEEDEEEDDDVEEEEEEEVEDDDEEEDE